MDTIARTHDFGHGEQTKHHVTSLGEQDKDNLRRGWYSLIKQRTSATVFRWQDVPRGGEDGVASYAGSVVNENATRRCIGTYDNVFVMWFLGSNQLGFIVVAVTFARFLHNSS